MEGDHLKTPELSGLKYDNCLLEKRMQESTGPGLFRLNDFPSASSNCFMEFSGYNNKSIKPLGMNVNTESELLRLDYKNSKCPEKRYSPMVNCNKCEKCNTGIPCGCGHCSNKNFTTMNCKSQLIPEYTKTTKACNLRDAMNTRTTERYDFPFRDMVIQSNSFIGENTRQDMKNLNAKIAWKK